MRGGRGREGWIEKERGWEDQEGRTGVKEERGRNRKIEVRRNMEKENGVERQDRGNEQDVNIQ